MAGTAVRHMRRVMVADEQGIGWANRPKTPWSKIRKLDASDLADKQILRLETDEGKTIVLDNYKLKNFKELVAAVEARVPASAIG